jgi:activator of HSP90 ATPase
MLITLIIAHSKDVYINAEDLKIKDLNITPTQSSPATPTPEQNSSTPKASTSASGSASQPTKKVVNTTTINETIEFVASAHDLYNVLVDQKLINAWSRSNATFPTEVGKEFSLFDGNITGKVLELVR